MARFHINPATGQAGECDAVAGKCPFGGEHFDSAAEARQSYEKANDSFGEGLEKAPSATASATATATAPEAKATLKPETLTKAQTFAETLSNLRANSPEFFEAVETVDSIGLADKDRLKALSAGLMKRSLASGLTNNSPQDKLAMDLSSLRVMVEELDPNAKPEGFMGALRNAFGGSRNMKAYFRKFESSGAQLQAIVEALDSGKDALVKDNINIKEERAKMWDTIQSLEATDKELTEMTEEINKSIASMETSDPETAELYRTEVLVPIQRKHQDILTEIGVAKLGYQSLDMIRKDNVSLMQTVDRTTSTTMSALQIAITQSQALDSQRRVIEQTKGVQDMASGLIARSAADLRSQSATINQSMNDPVVATESIKSAFADLYATMDEAAATKAKASEQMAKTIQTLKEEAAKAEQYMSKDN